MRKKERLVIMTRNQEASATLRYQKGHGRLGLPCWIAPPANVTTESIPLVVIHGIGRCARSQAECFGPRALSHGRLLIAPEFNKPDWPNYQQVVRKGRADLALLGLMNELRISGAWKSSKFELAGFSGGAQFAHRFAMLYPHLVSRLTVASAGWYTFPDSSQFPYGLGVRSEGEENWGPSFRERLDEFLRIPIRVAVGALDCERDATTRSSRKLNRQQGVHRVERGRRWCESLQRAAQKRGLPQPDIEFVLLPDSRHDFIECIEKGGLGKFVLPDAQHNESIVRR